MIIKSPPVYDISHWKIVKDFSSINPRPILILTKATECYPGTPFNNITDPKFVEYFSGMKAAGIARGAFHFFRKAYNALKQAEHFVNVVKPHITDKDILVLDVEEGGEKASQLWAWFHYVRSAFPNNICMSYSRKSVLDLIVMTQAEKDYFKQIPVWTAGYPYFVDLFTSVPFFYVPDQTRFGHVWLWQYSETGTVEGIQGAVDLNWIDPIFYELIKGAGETPPPTGEIIMWKYEYINIVGGMSIRPAPNANNTPIGTLPINVKGYGNELYLYPNGDKWVKIEQGGSAVGWVAVIHGGKPYGKLTELEPTPEPTPTTPEPVYKDADIHIVMDNNEVTVTVDGQPFQKV